MSSQDNKVIIEQALAKFNRPESREAYFEIYHPDCHYVGVGAGLEAIKQYYAGIFTAFPNVRVTPRQMIADGDKVAVEFQVTGTHQGDLMGIPPSGKAINISGMTIMRFADGKCVERWSQTDFLGILQQVGAVPTPQTA